jgi:hypothetical protein
MFYDSGGMQCMERGTGTQPSDAQALLDAKSPFALASLVPLDSEEGLGRFRRLPKGLQD